MLRPFMLSLVGLLATSTLHAQHIRFGVKAGLNASTYQGKQVPGARFRLGPAAGVLIRLPLGAHADLQPELLYEQRGARTSSEMFLVNGFPIVHQHQECSRLHYVSLPILLRLQKEKWFALLGPQVSGLLAAKQRVTDTYTPMTSTLDPDVAWGPHTTRIRGAYPYRRWEPSYVVGVGYQVATLLGVEVRYTAGLTHVKRPSFYTTHVLASQSELARNSSLQVQVSYQLGIL